MIDGALEGIPTLHLRHTSCGNGTTVVNRSLDHPVRFLQIGIAPKKFGGTPKENMLDASKLASGELALLLSVDGGSCDV